MNRLSINISVYTTICLYVTYTYLVLLYYYPSQQISVITSYKQVVYSYSLLTELSHVLYNELYINLSN